MRVNALSVYGSSSVRNERRHWLSDLVWLSCGWKGREDKKNDPPATSRTFQDLPDRLTHCRGSHTGWARLWDVVGTI